MSQKRTILIILLVFFVVAMIVSFKEKTNNNLERENNIQKESEGYEYDSQTGEYVIHNGDEEIARVTDEYRVKLYEDNPDYNPNPTY